jgi:hypothetical protein
MNRDKASQKDRRFPASEVGLYEELTRVKQAALRLYKNYPNVVGISTGTKYVKNTSTENHASIQFYVRKKGVPKNRKGNALPRFVYGRFKNGKVDRKLKFTTDVIEVGRVRMVCGAGSPISSSIGLTRRDGTMTFVFKNKAKSESNYYVVSCAHVIGNTEGQTELPVIIESESFPGITPFAAILFSPVQTHRRIEYDIAIAQVNSACLPLPDLKIAGTKGSIRSFMPKDQIIPSLPVSCVLPVSNAESGVVGSHGGWVRIEYGKKIYYEVENAWMVKIDGRVREGDSGGLIHEGKAAVGILFAASKSGEGWAWFHPLVDAFEYVRENVSMELKCFSS